MGTIISVEPCMECKKITAHSKKVNLGNAIFLTLCEPCYKKFVARNKRKP